MRPIDPTRLPLDGEHPHLAVAARRAIATVATLHNTLRSAEGATMWLQHTEFAWRAWYLADHLNSALDDADAARYPSAFGTLRTAMEHMLCDCLLLLADRYAETHEPYSPDEIAAFRAVVGADPNTDVVSIEPTRRGVRIVRKGHKVRDNDGTVVEQISEYWRVLEQHDATMGPPRVQAQFANGFIDNATLEDHARRNRELYRSYLTWSALLDNLVLNDLIAPAHGDQLDVHYRWLSSFTHATRTGYRAVERDRGDPSWNGRKRSHLLGELALLYAGTFAASELEWFCRFVDARPDLLVLENRPAIEAAIAAVSASMGYLWWPGGRPAPYDRVTEANHRAWSAYKPGDDISWPSAPDPASLSDADVGYYADPLDRLGKLHSGFREITTGLGCSPPW